MKKVTAFICFAILLFTACKPETGKFEGNWQDMKTSEPLSISHKGDSFTVVLAQTTYKGTGWDAMSDTLFLYANTRISFAYDKAKDHLIRTDQGANQEFERVGKK